MAVTYSHGASLKEGLRKTFDGQHPCQLCKLITEGKKSEKKQQAQLQVHKVDIFSVASIELVFNPYVLQRFQ